MTIVTALVTPKGAWLGADSLASDDELRVTSSSPKVAKFRNFLLGFSGGYGAGQAIFEMAKANPTLTLPRFVKAIKVKESGWSLLAVDYQGVYEINADRGMVKMQKTRGYSYGVTGSGSGVALGSLYADHSDQGSLLRAMKAAAAHTNHVRGPYKVISL